MTFPQTPLDVTVELGNVEGATWTDISADFDLRNPIHITRGRSDEAGQTAPQTCTLTLNNRLGKYSPRNPLGPYYGNLGRNTLIRVSVDTSVRFVGEVSEWPPRWDLSGKDHWVQITASGIMRRLGQGRPPVRSGFLAYILALDPNNYWPLNEGELAGYGRNASPHSAFAFTPWPSSGIFEPVYKFGTGVLDGLPNGLQISRTNAQGEDFPYFRGDLAISSDLVAVDFVFQHTDNPAQLTLDLRDYNDNTWRLALRQGALDDVEISHVVSSTEVATQVGQTGVLAALTDGELHHVRFLVQQDGADVDLTCLIDGVSVLAVSRLATTMDGAALLTFKYPQSVAESPMALGHVVVWRDDAPPDAADLTLAMRGFVGETAGQRMDRVAAEQLVGLTVVGDAAASTAMGRQIEGDLLTQVRDAAAADLGSLYEPRDTLGLAYRTRESLYNQPPVAIVDYSARELSPPFEPTDDDQLTRNDVTAKRDGGATARQTLTAGRLSTAEPPEGVGPYPNEVTVNVATDDQLGDIAGWLLHLGTWDESRYPTVVVDRATPDVAANPTLSAALLDVDVDDRIRLTGLEAVNVYGHVHLVVRGYTETLSSFSHAFAFNCSPALPYEVGEWNSDGATSGSRYQPGALRIWEDLTTTETAVDVLIDSDGLLDDDDAPFDLMIGGERMTLTAVTAEAITFVGVGAGDSDVNANVQAGLPAGTQVGDLVLIFTSIRNSPIGIPNTPPGWITLVDMANAKVFGRIYDGVWTVPVLTFAGGVAGADTIAQSCAFGGLSLGVFATTQLNASAQNIALPGVGASAAGVAIWCGWKQDDWTTPTPPAGSTLINGRLGQAGDDAGQVWAYRILSPHESLPASQFTISGGAAAISRGALVVVWAGQTLTVTRSVNGVVKTHEAGDAVALFEPARYAL